MSCIIRQHPLQNQHRFIGIGRCLDFGGESYGFIDQYDKDDATECGPYCDQYRIEYDDAFRGFFWDYYEQGYGSSLAYGTCRCIFDSGTLEEPIDDNIVTYSGSGVVSGSDGYSQTSSRTDVCYKVREIDMSHMPSGYYFQLSNLFKLMSMDILMLVLAGAVVRRGMNTTIYTS